MELESLISVDNFQVIKTAALFAAIFVNRQAAVVLFFHLAGEALFTLTSQFGGYYFCAAACMYAVNASSNIKISFNIRQALICISLINWLAAIDYFASPHETPFYVCYPWLINGLDVFILYCLLSHGGRQSVGAYRPLFYDLVRL